MFIVPQTIAKEAGPWLVKI